MSVIIAYNPYHIRHHELQTSLQLVDQEFHLFMICFRSHYLFQFLKIKCAILVCLFFIALRSELCLPDRHSPLDDSQRNDVVCGAGTVLTKLLASAATNGQERTAQEQLQDRKLHKCMFQKQKMIYGMQSATTFLLAT